jgi:hypothetical protein
MNAMNREESKQAEEPCYSWPAGWVELTQNPRAATPDSDDADVSEPHTPISEDQRGKSIKRTSPSPRSACQSVNTTVTNKTEKTKVLSLDANPTYLDQSKEEGSPKSKSFGLNTSIPGHNIRKKFSVGTQQTQNFCYNEDEMAYGDIPQQKMQRKQQISRNQRVKYSELLTRLSIAKKRYKATGDPRFKQNKEKYRNRLEIHIKRKSQN